MSAPKRVPTLPLPRFLSKVCEKAGKIVHYYQFNIGDYQSHTAHLSDIEDLAYRRLLDWYYLHERPIPLFAEEASRLIRMRTHTDSIAVVLNEFFELTDVGWIHHRADKEIAKAGDKSNKASQSAKARWNKKDNENKDILNNANAMRTHSESNATHNTLPITQDTLHNTQKSISTPLGVSQEVWQDFVKHRKAKKAQITDRVVESIAKQAQEAGWTLEDALKEVVVRNWSSFKAEWVVRKDLTKTGKTNQTVMAGLTRGLIGGGNVQLLK